MRVTDRTLRWKQDTRKRPRKKRRGHVRRERNRASVAQSMSFPEAVEADEISATFNYDVLTVRLNKSEPITQGKQIGIS